MTDCCTIATPPTQAGFLDFVRNVMGVPTGALPDDAPIIALVFCLALATANQAMECISPLIYQQMVYNLAGSFLLNMAPDQPGSTYFFDLRKAYGTNSFVPGLLTGASDEGTSDSLMVPDSLQNLTLANLQQLKDPFGRQYLAFAQSFGGTPWGLT